VRGRCRGSHGELRHRVRTPVCYRERRSDARVILCSRRAARRRNSEFEVKGGAPSTSARWIIAGFVPRKFATSIFG